jgi:hypothetical protein
MIIRFPYYKELRDRLNNFKGNFRELLIPNDNTKDAFVMIDEYDAPGFIDHFCKGLEMDESNFIQDNNSQQWPMHMLNVISGISHQYTIIEQRKK